MYKILKAENMEALVAKITAYDEAQMKRDKVREVRVVAVVHIPTRRKTDFQALVEVMFHE